MFSIFEQRNDRSSAALVAAVPEEACRLECLFSFNR